jgi:hypothetical protein
MEHRRLRETLPEAEFRAQEQADLESVAEWRRRREALRESMEGGDTRSGKAGPA